MAIFVGTQKVTNVSFFFTSPQTQSSSNRNLSESHGEYDTLHNRYTLEARKKIAIQGLDVEQPAKHTHELRLRNSEMTFVTRLLSKPPKITWPQAEIRAIELDSALIDLRHELQENLRMQHGMTTTLNSENSGNININTYIYT